jgi:hypothetical protein
MDIDTDRLNAFMGKMVGDFGAAMNASLMLIGDKLRSALRSVRKPVRQGFARSRDKPDSPASVGQLKRRSK